MKKTEKHINSGQKRPQKKPASFFKNVSSFKKNAEAFKTKRFGVFLRTQKV